MHFEITDKDLLYTVTAGSRLYGTNGTDSDTDYRSVYIAPLDIAWGIDQKFDSKDDMGVDGIDSVTYELGKFLKLARECNPNIIELLWVPQDKVVRVDPIFQKLVLNNRELFLSKRAEYTFKGYAHAQLKRITGHLKWLKNPPLAAPNRADFSLPEVALIKKDQFRAFLAMMEKELFGRLPLWEALRREDHEILWTELDKILALWAEERSLVPDNRFSVEREDDLKFEMAAKMSVDSNFIEMAKAERNYHRALAQWDQYQGWVRDRNAGRAALEAKYGYDTKHAMHLFRLLRMAKEIARDGIINVDRTNIDADELRDIRFNGSIHYDDLEAMAKKEEREVEKAFEKSSLPRQADLERINKIYLDICFEKYNLVQIKE
jgi:predicted nucleotidyltransferase